MTRNAYDFYPTPPWCYEKLPIDYSKYSTALEPAAGDHRLVKFLESKGLVTDYCEIQEDKDFFAYKEKVDIIVTNPPFSIAQEFITHALELADTVIMLLRVNFLGSQKRYPFWVNNEPKALYILSKRPSFTGTGTDSTEYAWYIWEKNTNHITPGVFHIL